MGGTRQRDAHSCGPCTVYPQTSQDAVIGLIVCGNISQRGMNVWAKKMPGLIKCQRPVPCFRLAKWAIGESTESGKGAGFKFQRNFYPPPTTEARQTCSKEWLIPRRLMRPEAPFPHG